MRIVSQDIKTDLFIIINCKSQLNSSKVVQLTDHSLSEKQKIVNVLECFGSSS